jgi:hypothetical protein
MATIKIDNQGRATVTMANGKVVPVPPGYTSMEIGEGGVVDVIHYPGQDRVLWFPSYQVPCDRDLADGESYTDDYGSTWTRYGDEMLVSDLGEVGEKAGPATPNGKSKRASAGDCRGLLLCQRRG